MAFLKRITPYAIAVLLLAVFYVRVPPPLRKTPYERLQTFSLYRADLPSVQATPYEYLMFVVQWPFAVCANKRCDYKPLPNNFTIHGIWPDCSGKEFNSSEMDEQRELEDNLRASWPDLLKNDSMKFWGWEYNKHGRCRHKNFSQTEYFQTAYEMWRRHSVELMFKDAGYEPGKNYSLTNLQGAIKEKTNKDPALRCRDYKDSKLALLLEVVICYDPDGIEVIDCIPTLSETCTKNNKTILWTDENTTLWKDEYIYELLYF